ncbi:MAG: MBG domain-containing protein, partial [Clostridia bacterium]|nr:MBG domain-containing protein [Clostridia bacterium]
ENCAFKGWSPELPATMPSGNLTVKALWANLYTITFDTDGGSAVAAITAEAGAAVTAPAAPTKENCAFKGWSPELPATMPSSDLTVKALWANLYTITWKNEDGTVIDTTIVEQDAMPVHDDPVKEATPDMEYAFESWTPAIVAATADAEYTAVFTGTVRQYTSGDYTYTLNAEGEATIIAWTGSAAELTVPQQLDGCAVVGIGPGAFASKGQLTRLDLPAGLRTIADNAFSGCPALETLLVPDSVEAIGADTLKDDAALKNFVLKAGLDRSLVAADSVQRMVTIDGVTTPVSVRFPMPFTDIEVNAPNLAFNVDCDFTVAAEHHLTVAQGSTLNVAGQRTLTNLGTITNNGALNAAGTLISCAGTYGGNAPQGNYVTAHSFQDGVCTVCGAEDADYVIELDIRYNGSKLTKVYDKTRNVSLKGSDFTLGGVRAGDKVKISKLSAAYDEYNAGERTVRVKFTLGGDDAKHYRAKDLTLSARITPKPLIITPTAGQKKTYGSADPAYITGKVRGLLSGDKMTGRLSRETGENAGQYRILAGTISAGNNYEIQVLDASFTIERKSINSTDVGLVTIGNQRYTGQAVTPPVTLRFGSNTLVENTDFKVLYENNVQPGTATVKLAGIGNYTGSRESAFRILNIASGVSFNSGSESVSYGYGGFEDGEYEEMEDFDGEGDGEDDEEPGETGMLFLEGNDYGLVLFNAMGEPWNFAQFEEEAENGSKVLTIIADPLMDDETGEPLFLDDGEREQYDELHLRLTLPTIRGLMELGYTEIIYELESAELRIPLADLRSEIPLDAGSDGAGTSLDVEQDDTELEGGDEELEMDIAPEAVQVAAYDFCVEQSEVLRLTDRELDALESVEPLTSAFRLRVRPMTQQDLAREDALRQSAADSGTALPIDNVDFDPMPENCYPEGLALYLMPLEDWDELPEDAGMLYISIVNDAADRDEMIVQPAQFEDVDGMNYVRFDPTADGLYCAGWMDLEDEADEEVEDE